ncbi:MAG: DUF1902 domain-containing protein [Comamonas sp.]
MKYYPAGWPLWRTLAKSGVPIGITVQVMYDPEAKVYVAHDSNLRGLVAEAETLDELRDNIRAGIVDLMPKNSPAPVARLTFEEACPA